MAASMSKIHASAKRLARSRSQSTTPRVALSMVSSAGLQFRDHLTSLTARLRFSGAVQRDLERFRR